MVVVLADDGNDGNLRLDGEVESALLEREESGLGVGSAGALGEDPERDTVLLHLVAGLLDRLEGVLAVLAVDEDGTGQPHWM